MHEDLLYFIINHILILPHVYQLRKLASTSEQHTLK